MGRADGTPRRAPLHSCVCEQEWAEWVGAQPGPQSRVRPRSGGAGRGTWALARSVASADQPQAQPPSDGDGAEAVAAATPSPPAPPRPLKERRERAGGSWFRRSLSSSRRLAAVSQRPSRTCPSPGHDFYPSDTGVARLVAALPAGGSGGGGAAGGSGVASTSSCSGGYAPRLGGGGDPLPAARCGPWPFSCPGEDSTLSQRARLRQAAALHRRVGESRVAPNNLGKSRQAAALHRCVATAYARGAALHLLGRVASLHVAHLDSSSAFSLSGFGAPAALARRPLL